MRQAFAGMLWSKQLYYYDVRRWLDGDPGQPVPPDSRRHGRNARWRSFNAFDIMSMPDKWEYPWFAAWDLAFHCVTLAHVDPGFAKYQLTLLCREWFQHPNGALPAYEWDFGDVNPPVQAWAVLEVFAIDGGRDVDFLSRVFDKLLLNFTWWVNLEDADGSNLFEGGFLGLDNIGPIDRSHLPPGVVLEQSDATGWMATYALAMGTIALVLRRAGQRPADDLVRKFLEHFAEIRAAIESAGLWDETDGLFYDRLALPDGRLVPVKVRSMVGIIPMLAAGVVDEQILERAQVAPKQFGEFLDRQGLRDREQVAKLGLLRGAPGSRQMLLGVVGIDRLERLFEKLFDPAEFLSPYGLRAISAYHREHPYLLETDGMSASIDYEPAESTTNMFGGNSNWRGPIWFPINYLVVACAGSLPPVLRRRLHRRIPHRVRQPDAAGRRLPRPVGQADLDLPGRPRRAAAVFRLGRAPAARPAVEGQPGVLRVLPRRQRRGAGRRAPDRLDRADRRRHPAPPRRGDLDR